MSTSADLTIVARPLDHPDSVALVADLQQYYVQIYGGHDKDSTDPAQFVPPAGLFLIGYAGDQAAACGGWRRISPDVCEIKRMYVAADHRGQGLARRLLAELESTARAAGATRMRLNTGYRQREAIALYESSGYVRSEGDRYGHYAETDGAFFYSKPL